MSETRYVVPEGLKDAIRRGGAIGRTADRAAEAAVRYFAEHPIVPTDAQVEEILGPYSLGIGGQMAKKMAVEWQRIVHLAPPEPKWPTELVSMMAVVNGKEDALKAAWINAQLAEAYRMGQESKERP